MAKKRTGGSTTNGRDSNSCRLGVKIFGNSFAYAGNIIVRQRGSTFHPGKGCFFGRDYSIHAKINGKVKFSTKNNKKIIEIV